MQKIYLSFPQYMDEALSTLVTMTQCSTSSWEDFCKYFNKQTFYKVQQQNNTGMKAEVKFA